VANLSIRVYDSRLTEAALARRSPSMLLMPGFGPDQALERAEEVRRRVEALRITHNGKDLGLTTVSLGLASAPDHCALDRLVETADAAMYRAKEAGRNQVAVAVARRPGRARRLSDAAGPHRRLSGPGRVVWQPAMRSSKWPLATGAYPWPKRHLLAEQR
jgi:hypothetical protein